MLTLTEPMIISFFVLNLVITITWFYFSIGKVIDLPRKILIPISLITMGIILIASSIIVSYLEVK